MAIAVPMPPTRDQSFSGVIYAKNENSQNEPSARSLMSHDTQTFPVSALTRQAKNIWTIAAIIPYIALQINIHGDAEKGVLLTTNAGSTSPMKLANA